MNRLIQKSGRAIQTWTKLRAKIFTIFCIANYASKNLQKFTKCVFYWKKNPDFFQKFPMISLAKKEKNENGKIRHYSFKMADNDLKLWQNNLLPNTFHMVYAKFDLFLRPISHGNPAMLSYKVFCFYKELFFIKRPNYIICLYS